MTVGTSKAIVFALTFAASTLLPLVSAESLKTKKWLTGKLLDAAELKLYSEQGETGLIAQLSGQQGARYAEQHDFFILHEDRILVVRQNLKPRAFGKFYTHMPRPASLTINAPVEFRFKGTRNIEILDEEGKKHKMRIVRKVLVEKPTSASRP